MMGDVLLWRDGGRPRTSIDGEIHVTLHSPDGYEWGYGGSGPADLALNILLLATGDREFAEARHQEFKRDLIACIPRDGGTVTQEGVDAWLHDHGWASN